MEIGTLTKVAIRDVWPTEDGRKSKAPGPGFTPWLANNADLLGEVLGMDLLHEGETEAKVGTGRLRSDVVFRDDSTQKTVVVENMFGTSDHDHLGKLISYAAGLKAAYAVLISENFKDEHRDALRWLNSNSDDCAFFGVTLEAWRIDDSPAAPWFRVEVQPDGWQPLSGETTELQDLYQEFWRQFLPEFTEQHQGWGRGRTPQKSSSMGFNLPGSWKVTVAFPRNGQQRVYMYCSKELFTRLHEQKAEIEGRFGGLEGTLDWDKADNQNASVISLLPPDRNQLSDKKNWPTTRKWLIGAAGWMREFIQHLDDETP